MPLIDQYLHQLLDREGSDLHLSIGTPIRARISGAIKNLDDTPLTADRLTRMLKELCKSDKWAEFKTSKELDFAYGIETGDRFRANFFYNHWGIAAVLRLIPAEIKSFKTLALPEVIQTLCFARSGLVFVTGPTGSGKSTTLAAMIDLINEQCRKHIITIEDPVEFVHTNKESVIVHREVGEHCHSFAAALNGAMRADPDILLVGEMRDAETIRLALNCASMGMLVFGTLHTNNAPMTIDRVIDAFPSDEQNQVRTMLGASLNGVISQILCKKISGGRIAAHEILLQHDALPNCIRSGKISRIRQIIEGSMQQGMITMDASLERLLKAQQISAQEAYMKATNKSIFEKHMQQANKAQRLGNFPQGYEI
ncbi:PilT/PilU family type 4a pilus ATPase [Coraliomargarita sp. SDUM461004]|uniref:PilT/PilU family type 4a pilus ATPase n=1 Tax=Thalassobacterium sedimentorum TaxID=3041258 RepID=A0ABU1AIS7_9BACT|nr:PilT/PilU family type 4a pilus ATPase [Coraliomargarita sp. SDUM461004]MDQ8194073.1 PilT/PilU family type 4a pilus ATPase [Coraliomargarita sp. SDUM461004]